MRDFVLVAKAIADPTRVRVLKMLQAGEMCVCEITEPLGLAQSTISKHLAILRNAGLVSPRKVGYWVHYRIETQAINAHNLAFLDIVSDSLDDDPQVLADAQLRSLCCEMIR